MRQTNLAEQYSIAAICLTQARMMRGQHPKVGQRSGEGSRPSPLVCKRGAADADFRGIIVAISRGDGVR